MAEHKELIVQFKDGVSEDDARKLVTHKGGTVRRKMRSDSDEQIMLLVKVPADQAGTIAQKLLAEDSVDYVEDNAVDYGIA